MKSVAYFISPIGLVRLEGRGSALKSVRFVEEREDHEENPELLQTALDQLQEFFDGRRTNFEVELAPEGTSFQQSVWSELQEIPFGKTLTYMEVAHKLGDLKVIRAAASANGKNPICIVIPCHRVIGKDGSLVGYSGGIHRKKWLLNFEQCGYQTDIFGK